MTNVEYEAIIKLRRGVTCLALEVDQSIVDEMRKLAEVVISLLQDRATEEEERVNQ